MKVLHVVNVADAQSIPLELALAIRARAPSHVVAGYYAGSDHPVEDLNGTVFPLDARRPFDRSAIARLRKLLRDEDPDIW